MTTLLEKRNFYFKGFPVIDYTLDGEDKQVLDFIHRWKIRESVKSNGGAYSEWIIRDSDTLRRMAFKLYKSEHYYWLIMMMNDMLDPFYDWPFDETALMAYIINIYGSENIYNHHHWESEEDGNLYSLPEGEIVSEDYPYNKISINNFDYESVLNEAKRNVRLLRPEYLTKIVAEKEAILLSNFNRS